jgi:hypothetical protein
VKETLGPRAESVGNFRVPQRQSLPTGSSPMLENAPRAAQTDTPLYICAILSIVTAVGALLCLVDNLLPQPSCAPSTTASVCLLASYGSTQ